jgi:hypothetical protein
MFKLFKTPSLDKQMLQMLAEFQAKQVEYTLAKHRVHAQIAMLDDQIAYLRAKLHLGADDGKD